MTTAFDIVESRRGDHVVLTVTGELDPISSPGLRERIVGLLAEGESKIVVDLEGVSFLDSSGLNALVAARNSGPTDDTKLALVCTKPGMLKVFSITQLDAVFPIHASVDAALTA